MPLRAVLLLLMITAAVTAEGEPDAMDAVYTKPPATGLLVTLTVADSQATAVGILPGDVLTLYDGKMVVDLGTLRALVAAAAGKAQVEATLVQRVDGKPAERKVNVKPGKLGVNGVAVTADKDCGVRAERPVPLPPATAVKFDFARLKAGPLDLWHDFFFGGKKAGFEHFKVELVDGTIHALNEFAFDGGKDFGIISDYVRSVSTDEAQPQLTSLRQEGDRGDASEERLVVEGAARQWEMRSTVPGAESVVKRIPYPTPSFAGALLMPLAGFMPREPGACVHFSVYDPRRDQVQAVALRVVAKETITLPGGAKVDCWRIQHHGVRGPEVVSWVDDQGRLVKNDFGENYGGANSALSDRAKATAGLDARIKVRSGE